MAVGQWNEKARVSAKYLPRLIKEKENRKMLKIKYKMHRLVNMIFYFIIFALGFLLGGGNIENIKETFISWFM